MAGQDIPFGMSSPTSNISSSNSVPSNRPKRPEISTKGKNKPSMTRQWIRDRSGNLLRHLVSRSGAANLALCWPHCFDMCNQQLDIEKESPETRFMISPPISQMRRIHLTALAAFFSRAVPNGHDLSVAYQRPVISIVLSRQKPARHCNFWRTLRGQCQGQLSTVVAGHSESHFWEAATVDKSQLCRCHVGCNLGHSAYACTAKR